MKNLKKLVLVALLAGLSVQASAAVDTTAILAELTSAGTAAQAVGVAVLVIIVGIAALKMIRRAL